MKAYGYIAYTDSGQRRRGTVVAETEAQAARQLQDQGLFVSQLSGGTESTADQGRAGRRRRWRGQLSADLQMVLTRQMAVLLSAGLPVEMVLKAMGTGGGTAGGGAALDAVAARTRAALMQGSSLGDALAQSGAGFARYYLAAVRAGERAGDLSAVFEELANHLEQIGSDRAQITTALIYPAFVATVSLLVCAVLMVNVAPEIVAMFETAGRPLPELTQNVLAMSTWIQTHPVLLASLAGLIIAGLVAVARVPGLRHRRDVLLLKLPLVGHLMRQAAAVQYLRTLALVLTSRHAVLSATDSAAEVLSISRFQAEGARVSTAVRSGESLSSALRHLSFIPAVALQLVSAGETSARLAPMAERSAVLVENALSAERKRIAALLEPMLMILVGGFVLLVVLAVLLPIFDLQAMVSL